MNESVITTPLVLPANDSAVAFQQDSLRTRSATCACWLQHGTGSPLYKILKGGIYDITFDATVTSTTAGIVAIGLAEDGVVLPCTIRAETLAAAGDLANLALKKTIRVCCAGDTTLTLVSVPSVLAGATLVATATQVPTITSATFSIRKIG